jgi:hypothetical protein
MDNNANRQGPFTGEDTKQLAIGAAIGGVAGAILPFVSLPLGAIAGAGWVAYKRFVRK